MLLVRARHVCAALIASVGLVAACVDAPTRAPVSPAARGSLPELGHAALVDCPSTQSQSTVGVVGPLGGVLTLGAHVVDIPAGAVGEPTAFVLTVPSSRHMTVDVSAVGVEHYVFNRPISVTLDYSRCGPSAVAGRTLRVWYVESLTETPLEDMGGVVDSLAQTITFSTPHLSGYALGE